MDREEFLALMTPDGLSLLAETRFDA
ncbi:MAG: hypothetical protein RL719_675, partial [Actinomycetota bacterium]